MLLALISRCALSYMRSLRVDGVMLYNLSMLSDHAPPQLRFVQFGTAQPRNALKMYVSQLSAVKFRYAKSNPESTARADQAHTTPRDVARLLEGAGAAC